LNSLEQLWATPIRLIVLPPTFLGFAIKHIKFNELKLFGS